MKEDNIRIALQELSGQTFNEDDVIGELQAMVNDLTKTDQAIPQVVEPQKLSDLNGLARQRIHNTSALVVSHDSIHVRQGPTPSPESSPGESWV